jgi:tetratricopeptide (TPR) repeat protein
LVALVRVFLSMAALAAISVLAIYYGFLTYSDLRPPALDEQPSADLEIDPQSRRLTLGRSWMTRHGGLWELHLAGTPREIGSTHAQLAGRLFSALDRHIAQELTHRYPSDLDAWAERMRLRWDYREADATLREADRLEIAALARDLPESVIGELVPYHRAFLFQSLFDLSQQLPDPLVDGTMFAVKSKAPGVGMQASKIIVGRNFSVDLGTDFRIEPMVMFYFPDGKYPFVSVGWAGFTGVVTGVNARGVVVAANAARTDLPRNESGRTLPLILRQVLEDADSLESALLLLKTNPVRTAGTVLLADGNQGRAMIVEMAPRGADAREVRGENDAMIWATDHLARTSFERDAENDRTRRFTVSGQRFARIGELLTNPVGFGPAQAAAVLRDRKGLADQNLGLGHPAALDNLSLTHSAVIDATSMVLWVCEGPSALGRYRAFDLRYLLRRERDVHAPPEDIEPDRILHSEHFHDFQQARLDLAYARTLFEQSHLPQARSAVQVALSLAPDHGEAHRLMGDISRELGDYSSAVTHYKRYLELTPDLVRDRERVLGILDELER